MTRSALWAGVFAVVALGASCGPTGPTPGGRCTDDDDFDVCFERSTMRCTNGFYVVLAECTASCPANLDPVVTHEQLEVTGDETWTCLEGTHLVTGTVTVREGATLTLEPGARVRIDPSSHIDVEPGARIVIDALPFAPVIMTSNNGQSAGFGTSTSGGLNVFAAEVGEPSVLRNLIVERGIHGLGLFGLSTAARTPIVQNSTFRDNENFGVKVACAEEDFVIPDFEAACSGDDQPCGNNFFGNGRSPVSACNEAVTP